MCEYQVIKVIRIRDIKTIEGQELKEILKNKNKWIYKVNERKSISKIKSGYYEGDQRDWEKAMKNVNLNDKVFNAFSEAEKRLLHKMKQLIK